MYHFHLTKYWFDKFKDGSKSVEYRFYTERLKKQIFKDMRSACSSWSSARLYCGYPKKDDSSRILRAKVVCINFPLWYQLPADVREFMLKNCKEQIFEDSVFVAFQLREVSNV